MPIRKSEESVKVKRGTTQNRPSSPMIGDLYYDTTLDGLIQYKQQGWQQIAPVPNAPTNVSATAGINNDASVSFTGPTNVSVSSYTVTSSPGNITATGSSSPITITGLTTGTSYTFTVKAKNDNGDSAPSSSSNSITATLVPTVSGGTLTSDATYYYRTFTGNGTLTVSNTSLDTIALIVGGGGSGHYYGGGGAGGYISQNMTLSPSSYNVVVGSSGNSSSFNGQTASAGGSASGLTPQAGAGSGAPTSYGGGGVYPSRAGGGGGGSSGVGQSGRTNNNNGVDGIGGAGGPGTQWINGVTYAAGGSGAGNWAGGAGNNSGGLLGNGGNGAYNNTGHPGQQGIVIIAYLKSAVGG